MKIVAICQRSYFGVTGAGGAETMLASLLSHLVLSGWEAEAVVTNYRGQPRVVDGVRVYGAAGEQNIRKAAASADVIITHLGTSMIAKRVGASLNKPVVQLIHNTNEYTIGFLGSGCDFAIYNSEWVKNFHDTTRPGIVHEIESRTRVALRVRKAHDWPNMIVRPPVPGPDLMKGGGPDGFVTLINLVPNKGPDVFYDLAERNPQLKFMAVIGGYETNQQVVKHLPNVTIQPHVQDMDAVYSRASVLLVPSIYESYGRVAVEAMQYGIPVIASPTPGLKECLGSEGWFRDRDDRDGWNSALRWTLDNYDARSQAAYARYEQLVEMTEIDLVSFTEKMGEVCRGTHRHR